MTATNKQGMALVLAISLATATAFAAGDKSQAQWERCVARAEASVNQMEVGVRGVEAKIVQMCGTPPVRETVEPRGSAPYDLVRSKQWRPRFAELTRGKYAALVDRLTVASPTERSGDWIVGSGLMPHRGGSDEAAFAIDTKTDQVFAAMLEGGTTITTFGFRSTQDAPPYLRAWLMERKR